MSMPLLIVSSRLYRFWEQALIQSQKLRIIRHCKGHCYYRTKREKESYFAKHHSDFSEESGFIIHAYSGSACLWKCRYLYGANETAKSLAMESQLLCRKMEIPEVSMSFLMAFMWRHFRRAGTVDRGYYIYCRFFAVYYHAASKGVVFHNLTTGKTALPEQSNTFGRNEVLFKCAAYTDRRWKVGHKPCRKYYKGLLCIANWPQMTVCRIWHLYLEKEWNRNSTLNFCRVDENAKIELVKKDQGSRRKCMKERYMVYIVMKIAQIDWCRNACNG